MYDERYGCESDQWWQNEGAPKQYDSRHHRKDKVVVAVESKWAGPSPTENDIKVAYRRCGTSKAATQELDSDDATRYSRNAQGMIFYQRRAQQRPRWLVPHALRQRVLWLAHGSREAGHNGVYKTAQNLRMCWWPNMGSTIKAFVNRCDTCNLRNKFRNKFRMRVTSFACAQTKTKSLKMSLPYI